MTNLFAGTGTDPAFSLLKSNPAYADIKSECERLWSIFHPIAESNFADQFPHKFHDSFWELYLGAFLKEQHQAKRGTESSNERAPDFMVPGTPTIYVEATNASRGCSQNKVPSIATCDSDDNSEPSYAPVNECVIRITAKLEEKATANDAEEYGRDHPYIIAINLPFPEAWVGEDVPLSARAMLGIGGRLITQDGNEPWKSVGTSQPFLQKKNKSKVKTTAFCNSAYAHIAALVVASVNPFSSCYKRPAIEVLHNPNATNPLKRGWLGLGTEYWVEGGKLCHTP